MKLLDDMMPNFDVMRSCLNRKKEKPCHTLDSKSSSSSEISSETNSPARGSVPTMSTSSPKSRTSAPVFEPGDQVKWFSESEGKFLDTVFTFINRNECEPSLALISETLCGREVFHYTPVEILSHTETEPQAENGWTETSTASPSKIARVWHRKPVHSAAYLYEDSHWEAVSSNTRYPDWVSLRRAIESGAEK